MGVFLPGRQKIFWSALGLQLPYHSTRVSIPFSLGGSWLQTWDLVPLSLVSQWTELTSPVSYDPRGKSVLSPQWGHSFLLGGPVFYYWVNGENYGGCFAFTPFEWVAL